MSTDQERAAAAYEAGHNRGLTGSELPLSHRAAIELIPESVEPLYYADYLGGWEDGLRNRNQKVAIVAELASREDEDGPDDPTGTHAAHRDVWRDGGWEDVDGFPVPLTTAPDCDRTCLPCQGDDHAACGMGCHDEEDAL